MSWVHKQPAELVCFLSNNNYELTPHPHPHPHHHTLFPFDSFFFVHLIPSLCHRSALCSITGRALSIMLHTFSLLPWAIPPLSNPNHHRKFNIIDIWQLRHQLNLKLMAALVKVMFEFKNWDNTDILWKFLLRQLFKDSYCHRLNVLNLNHSLCSPSPSCSTFPLPLPPHDRDIPPSHSHSLSGTWSDLVLILHKLFQALVSPLLSSHQP